jgi:hypothetical protein
MEKPTWMIISLMTFWLSGCTAANIAANEAAVQQFLASAEADIALVYSAAVSECAAVSEIIQDATVAACLISPTSKTANTTQRVVAAAQAACSTATSSQPTNALQGILATATSAYSAAKSVQVTGTCI